MKAVPTNRIAEAAESLLEVSCIEKKVVMQNNQGGNQFHLLPEDNVF